MLTHYRYPVCLSFLSTDLPICSELETVATLYQKDESRFHLLMTEPSICDRTLLLADRQEQRLPWDATPRLLWLELSPYRVTLSMQGNGQFSYRHFWERGVYGLSRYWLQSSQFGQGDQLRLRNFTRNLTLEASPLPRLLRIDYELWSASLVLGHYVLMLEIRH
jgi:hypothetical protein